MKRALLLIPAAIMAVLALAPVADAQDYTWTDNGDGTCTITRYLGPGGDVTIPDTLGGLTVTDIGSCAFLDRTSLTDITLPDSVITIGVKAFYNCTSLTSITIPDSVIAIGGATFTNCTSLTSVTIGNSLTIIASEAFFYCTSLTSITIPDSVTIIGYYAFYGCTSLTDITIPDSVTIIGDYAFYNCTGLLDISVDAANSNYSSISGVLFNKIQTQLLQYPAGKAGSYIIPASVLSIEKNAFYHCTNLTNVTIPDSVTTIGSLAFYYCTRLTDITIPDNVTTIEDYAFAYDSSLTSIYCIGDAPDCGFRVFYNVSNATVYYRPDTTGWSSTYGGLPTAIWPLADADYSTTVDIGDFAMLSGQWLQRGCGEANGWCGGADFDRSGGVDAADLLLLANDWLWP